MVFHTWDCKAACGPKLCYNSYVTSVLSLPLCKEDAEFTIWSITPRVCVYIYSSVTFNLLKTVFSVVLFVAFTTA